MMCPHTGPDGVTEVSSGPVTPDSLPAATRPARTLSTPPFAMSALPVVIRSHGRPQAVIRYGTRRGDAARWLASSPDLAGPRLLVFLLVPHVANGADRSEHPSGHRVCA